MKTNSEDLQLQLFQRIKNSLPSGISLADEVADVLNITLDSSYRRIRGEKSLVFDEIFTLCAKFNISIDDIFNNKTKGESFLCRIIDANSLSFENYLKSLYKNITYIQTLGNPEITYFAKDIPIFQHFHIPELAAFKLFFWSKTLIMLPEFADKKFDCSQISETVLEIGKNTLAVYNKIPSIEIWNEETVNSAIRQIEFYFTGGIIPKKDDALMLLHSYDLLFQHIGKQAEGGCKFLPGAEPLYPNNYKFYFNEVIQGDNSIFVKSDTRRISFTAFNVLSLMVSDEEQFCMKVESYLKTMMKKSMLLSEVSEKERNRFFNLISDKIRITEERIKNS
jgi:hypothetical protein